VFLRRKKPRQGIERQLWNNQPTSRSIRQNDRSWPTAAYRDHRGMHWDRHRGRQHRRIRRLRTHGLWVTVGGKPTTAHRPPTLRLRPLVPTDHNDKPRPCADPRSPPPLHNRSFPSTTRGFRYVDIVPAGSIQYRFILTVCPRGHRTLVLFVTSEVKRLKRADPESGSQLLCTFDDSSHTHYRDSDEWADEQSSVINALAIIPERLGCLP
jgi:hypothetical protein